VVNVFIRPAFFVSGFIGFGDGFFGKKIGQYFSQIHQILFVQIMRKSFKNLKLCIGQWLFNGL
jgi:hypothetical protein